MSDNSNPEKETAAPQLSIKGIYLRNTSFETGSSLLLLRPGSQPEMKLELRVQINPLEKQDEVLLDLTVTARDNSNLLYLIKIQQAGCFVLSHFTPEQKAFFLNTTCPSILYPHACHMANTLSVQGGFPPVHLMPIDFVHLYTQQQQAAAVQAQKSNGLEKVKPVLEESIASKNKWAELAISADIID
jgi:preprotein translocase subunit SecB